MIELIFAKRVNPYVSARKTFYQLNRMVHVCYGKVEPKKGYSNGKGRKPLKVGFRE